MSEPSPLWYATRASGLVSMLLLTAVVALGVLVTVRWSSHAWSGYLLQAIHRYLSLLALVFLGLHIVTAVLDPFAKLGALDAVIPFRGQYRPFWLGLGVMATDLLAAVLVTSLMRARIGFRLWRIVHWLAYLCWPMALLHSIGTGTDTRAVWGLGIEMLCLVAVLVAVAVRIAHHRRRDAVIGVVVPAAAVGVIALAIWMAGGPLAPGWARAAGTPQDLLAASAATADAPATPTPSAATAGLPAGLRDRLRGAITQTATGLNQLQLSDVTNSALAVTLTDPADGSGMLLFALTDNGATVCSASVPGTSATIETRCGAVAVGLRLRQDDDGGVISGVLTTA